MNQSTETIQTAALVHWISSVPVGVSICLLGIIGNSISILVWARVRKKIRESNSTIKYFISMGVIDSGLLIMFILTDSIPAAEPEFIRTYWFVVCFSYIFFPLFFFFILASIWIVVAVTADRYLLIVHQFKLSRKMHTLSLVLLFVSGFIINVPHFFNFQPKMVEVEPEKWIWEKTEYAESESGSRYEFWVHCIFIVLAPWMLIAAFNVGIVLTIFKTSKQVENVMSNDTNTTTSTSTTSTKLKSSNSSVPILNKDLIKRRAQNRRTTSTLLTVTFTFLVLLLWQCIVQCFWMQEFHKHDTQQPQIWEGVDISFGLAKLGIVLYSSINCILYFLTGTLFKRELRELTLSIKQKIITFFKD